MQMGLRGQVLGYNERVSLIKEKGLSLSVFSCAAVTKATLFGKCISRSEIHIIPNEKSIRCHDLSG